MSMFTVSTRNIGSFPVEGGVSNKDVKIFKIGKSKNHTKNFSNTSTLMQTGGISAGFFTSEAIEHLKKLWVSIEENQDFITQVEPGVPFVQYDEELEKSVSSDALEVLIVSTLGRIKYGQLFKNFQDPSVSEEFDLMADAYAAKVHGPEAVVTAIKASYIDYVYTRQKALLGFDTSLKDWWVDTAMESYPTLAKRLEVLHEQIKD